MTASIGAEALPFVIPTGVAMGLRPIQGDEKGLCSLLPSHYSQWKRPLPFVIPTAVEGSAVLSSVDNSFNLFMRNRRAGSGCLRLRALS
jgi:hypothetical protein